MNYRDRDLLNLCYEFDCELRIEGVCEGGRGEPCHANWSDMGKGGAMKAHDCFVVPGCRACHRALDQGSTLEKAERRRIWEAAFWRFLPKLWQRGLLTVNRTGIHWVSMEQAKQMFPNEHRPFGRKGSKRGSQCTASAKTFPRVVA